MADTRGITPLDPATDVGRFRLLSGDTEFVEYVPPQPGYGLYANWGDVQIQAFIDAAGGSLPRAIALAYSQLASYYASSGGTIKTDDLSYSSKDSVGSWMSLAKYWNDLADNEDNKAINDYFDLVPTGADSDCRKPEAAPWPLAHLGFGPGTFRW